MADDELRRRNYTDRLAGQAEGENKLQARVFTISVLFMKSLHPIPYVRCLNLCKRVVNVSSRQL